MPMKPAAQANPRAISVRIKSINKSRSQGQRRHDLRIGKQPKYVDEKRGHLNRHLIEAKTAAELVGICNERREGSGIERKRKVASNVAVATIGIITFGREARRFMEDLTDDQQDALFTEVADRVTERLGTSVTGLSVHLDEAGLHAHFQAAATSIYGGPVSRISTKAVLNDVQSIAAEIAQKYDPRIERGNRKVDRLEAGADYADVVHRTVNEMHYTLIPEFEQLTAENIKLATDKKHLENQIANESDILADIARMIGNQGKKLAKNQKYLEKAQATAEQANLDEARSNKAKKNIETYTRRVAAASTELERLDGLKEAAESTLRSAENALMDVQRV